MLWCKITGMMWGEIIGWCGVRVLLNDVGWYCFMIVGWDFSLMWDEIIGKSWMRLLNDVVCEIITWSGDEIIAWCGAGIIAWCGVWDYWHDLAVRDYCRMWVRDYCIMWGEILEWYCVRLLDDVGWDYCMIWGEIFHMIWGDITILDEIIEWCGLKLQSGMRLLHDVAQDYWHDVMWDFCMIWCVRLLCLMWWEIIARCSGRFLNDIVWDYWMM